MLNADVKEFEFTSAFDGLKISAVIAAPSGTVNGIIQIVHGMYEYKERYEPFMDYLAGEGFITVIHDNRGHGKSICNQEDLGFMYKDGSKGFVEDIAQLAGIVKDGNKNAPYFMIGHGMGSLGARIFTKENDAMLNGLIISGSPYFGMFSPFARSIRSSLHKKLGSQYRSDKINDLMEVTLNKKFAKEELRHSWLCSNSEVVEQFNSDPLSDFIFTLNGYESLLNLMKEAYSKKGWLINNQHLPIRFISGKDDPCMQSEKDFFKAISSLEKCGYESISHRLFDGMRHDILNENNSIIVYKDIAKTLFSWIDRL